MDASGTTHVCDQPEFLYQFHRETPNHTQRCGKRKTDSARFVAGKHLSRHPAFQLVLERLLRFVKVCFGILVRLSPMSVLVSMSLA